VNERSYLRIGWGRTASRASCRRERFSCPPHEQSGGSEIRDRSEIERDVQSANVKPPDIILLPLDVHKCPLEVFSYVNQFAEHHTKVILLHVVNLSVVPPDGRVFDELSCAAGKDLKRLSERFLDPRLCISHQVRFGKPANEILSEASESKADLIALTTYRNGSFWKDPLRPRIIERVIRSASCDLMLLHVRTRFNCEEDWLYVNEFASAMESTGLFKVPMQCLV
jgi:nucleotide-binding universal stress UspA family protein